ncbi:ATP synthase subunit I [Sulfurirhabdus autotrophica]|uniref:ATP synthase protein I n=1 Tax=Sulfurirhabdus autotrophica TaxID=1706046 RepID=A0A4R3XVJ5_9PROT|nr:ATP synthase subunit I [Sulfurirhabdus autotrophica]TCV82228.1 ATP synthase protein I [Sulfurirhabdus autotrophica]
MPFITNWLVRAQIVVTSILFMVGYVTWNRMTAIAILFGSLVAMANVVILVWRMNQAEKRNLLEVQKNLHLFYRSSLERFIFVALLLASGMGSLGLNPIAVLVGFALGQLTLIVSQIMHGIKSN